MQRDEVVQLVEEYLARRQTPYDEPVAVVEHRVRRLPYGWLVPYQSVRYLRLVSEKGEENLTVEEELSALFGNAPLLVMDDGALLNVFGTDRPIREQLQEFERERGLAPSE